MVPAVVYNVHLDQYLVRYSVVKNFRNTCDSSFVRSDYGRRRIRGAEIAAA